MIQYPLSPMQAGMLFRTLENTPPSVYVQQFVIDLHEEIDSAIFQQAWQQLVHAHSILRASFHWQDDVPSQRIHSQVELEWQEQDWSDLSTAEQKVEWKRWLADDLTRKFEMNHAPLMRIAFFKLAKDEYRCLWTSHHAILDGRSYVIILKELFGRYDALRAGQKWDMPSPRPYQDFIEWKQQHNPPNAESFWSTLLHNAEPAQSLPPATASPATNNNGYGNQKVTLSAETTTALNTLVNSHNLTLHTLVQGAWMMMLSQFTGHTDIIVGTTRAGRHTIEGSGDMVGLFINALPVRTHINLDAPLLDLLRDLRRQSLAIRPYEQMPLTDVGKLSNLPPAAPLFSTIMVFEKYQVNEAMQKLGDGFEKRNFSLIEQDDYPLTGSAYGGTELLLTLSYTLSRYTEETGKRFLHQWQCLLQTMASDGLMQTARSLPLLTSSEQQLLQTWNDTAVSHPPINAIQHLFEKQVEERPEATAVVFNDEKLTYAELNHRANQLAHHLQTEGIEAEKFVGIFLDRSFEMIVALMGVLKAGAAYLPLDPTYPPERIALMLADVKPAVLLTRQALLNKLPLDQQKYNPIPLCLDSDWAIIAQQSDHNPIEQGDPDNLAYIIYTSGSTGTPKGVMVPHKSLINYTLAGINMFELTPDDHVLQFASFSFDTSAEEIMPCLASGAALILRTDTMIDSISSFFRNCDHYGLSVIDLPTAYWHELTAVMTETQLQLPPSLRLIIIGGEAALPERVAVWQEYVGQQVRLLNTYGATELTIISTMYDLTSEYQDTLTQVPIGRPIQNVQTYILDKHQRPTPIGLPGELYFGGAGLARGYLNRPKLTDERFITRPDRFFYDTPVKQDALLKPVRSRRLYKSGDVARYLPDGNIEYLGRVDFQVKIRGFRVEMGEIESVLSLHPDVRMTAVTPHGKAGEQMLVAYIVPQTDAEHPTTMAMRHYLRQKMPDYMIPSAFVYLDEFPLTSSRKIDRKALPKPDFQSAATAPVPPRNHIEKILLTIWQELLSHPITSVHDNFFEVGGHSILAIQMFSQLRDALNVELNVNILFQSSTIAELAEVIQEQQIVDTPQPNSTSNVILVRQGASDQPNFFCMHGAGGNVLFMQEWKPYFDQWSLFGVESPSVDGLIWPTLTIEEMAANYIKNIQKIQPHGPYLLGGYSDGGIIAYEMTQQLKAQGEQIDLLLLIDTYHTSVESRTYNWHTRFKRLMRQPWSILTYAWQRKISVPLGILYLKKRYVERGVRVPIAYRERLMTNYFSSTNYEPKPYQGWILLARSLDIHYVYGHVDSQLGWGELSDSLDVIESQSNHFTIVHEPFIKQLSKDILSIWKRRQASSCKKQIA